MCREKDLVCQKSLGRFHVLTLEEGLAHCGKEGGAILQKRPEMIHSPRKGKGGGGQKKIKGQTNKITERGRERKGGIHQAAYRETVGDRKSVSERP